MFSYLLPVLLTFAGYHFGFDSGRSQGKTETFVLCKKIMQGGGDGEVE